MFENTDAMEMLLLLLTIISSSSISSNITYVKEAITFLGYTFIASRTS